MIMLTFNQRFYWKNQLNSLRNHWTVDLQLIVFQHLGIPSICQLFISKSLKRLIWCPFKNYHQMTPKLQTSKLSRFWETHFEQRSICFIPKIRDPLKERVSYHSSHSNQEIQNYLGFKQNQHLVPCPIRFQDRLYWFLLQNEQLWIKSTLCPHFLKVKWPFWLIN